MVSDPDRFDMTDVERADEEQGCCAIVVLAILLCALLFGCDAMMDADAADLCARDGGATLTAQQTQDVCEQAGVVR